MRQSNDFIYYFAFAIIIGIAICLLVGWWKIFKKTGKPGWYSIIPLLNTWHQYELSWNSNAAWVSLVLGIFIALFQNANNSASNDAITGIYAITALVVFVMNIIMLYKLAKAFGKGFGFFVGLLLLNPIFIMILGCDDSKYQKNIINTNNIYGNYSNYYNDNNNYTNFSNPDYYNNTNNTNNPQPDDKLEPW